MYQAVRKKLRVKMLTRVGWLEGTLHMPERSFLADFMTAAPEFVALTDVTSPARPAPLPYFSLSRDALRVVTVPPEVVNVSSGQEKGALRRHKVYLVLDTGTIVGEIEALPNTRVSDFFSHRRGFVPVFDATLEIGAIAGASAVSEHCGTALVLVDHVVGVGEM
jgi:hypothetical protein